VLRALVLASVTLLLGATPLPQRTDRLIYDTAGVIDDGAERALEPRLAELFQKTGVAIVVLTVPQLVDETISELAVRAGQTWGVGRRGEDRGVVVALAARDREIFVATGYGTEGYLPDGRVGALIDQHALPYLRANRFSDGLVALTVALIDASAREYDVSIGGAAPQLREPPPGLGPVPIIIGILAIIGFALLAARHPMLAFMLLAGRGFGRGGGFGGGFGAGGFGGGGFGGGGAGRSF
jgi:uncharacterized protein